MFKVIIGVIMIVQICGCLLGHSESFSEHSLMAVSAAKSYEDRLAQMHSLREQEYDRLLEELDSKP